MFAKSTVRGSVAIIVLAAVAFAVMVFVSVDAAGLHRVREGFDASNTDAGAAVAETALRDAPVSRVMTPFGAVRACGSANNVCGTRDGYFAGDLVVGENLGVAGDISVKGNLKEVTNVSILRALSVNGMANFDKDVSVGGRVTAGGADIAGALTAGSANVRGALDVARLDVAGNARISGSAEVSRNVSSHAGVLSLSGAGYFQAGLGAGGNIVAGGDVMALGDHMTAGSVIAAGSVVAGRRVVSNGDAAFNGSLTANGGVQIRGDLGVKKTAKFGGALDVGQSVTVGGNVFADGGRGVVVNNGAVRVGALPAGAEGGALASGLHVERGNGRRTSFPRSGDNLIDGTVLVGDKVCVGEECMNERTIAAFKGYPALFNGKIRDASAVSNTKLANLGKSFVSRFSDVVARMSKLGVRIGVNEAGLVASRKVDAAMQENIAGAEVVLKRHDDGIVRIDNRNDLQDVRLDTLERRLETLEGRMLGAVNAAMVNDQARLTTCESKPVPPAVPWKLTVYRDGGLSGDERTYDQNNMAEFNNMGSTPPGGVTSDYPYKFYSVGTPFGVSSWRLEAGDNKVKLFFTDDTNVTRATSWYAPTRNIHIGEDAPLVYNGDDDFDLRSIVVASHPIPARKPSCS